MTAGPTPGRRLRVVVRRGDDGPTVLHLSGPLEPRTVDWCLDAVESALLDGHHELVVDASEVSLLDPEGLEALDDALAAVTQCGGSLRIRTPRPHPGSDLEPVQEGRPS